MLIVDEELKKSKSCHFNKISTNLAQCSILSLVLRLSSDVESHLNKMCAKRPHRIVPQIVQSIFRLRKPSAGANLSISWTRSVGRAVFVCKDR